MRRRRKRMPPKPSHSPEPAIKPQLHKSSGSGGSDTHQPFIQSLTYLYVWRSRKASSLLEGWSLFHVSVGVKVTIGRPSCSMTKDAETVACNVAEKVKKVLFRLQGLPGSYSQLLLHQQFCGYLLWSNMHPPTPHLSLDFSCMNQVAHFEWLPSRSYPVLHRFREIYLLPIQLTPLMEEGGETTMIRLPRHLGLQTSISMVGHSSMLEVLLVYNDPAGEKHVSGQANKIAGANRNWLKNRYGLPCTSDFR